MSTAKARAVVGMLALVLAGCSSGYDSTAPGGTTGGNTSGNAGGSNGPAVSISGFAFAPVADTVAVGTTVTWTNKDAATHTVTADDASFDSGDVGNGGTYTRTFNSAGTYTYHCAIHSGMRATILVR